MKNGRINERNTGDWSLDGESKQRRRKTPKLSAEQFDFAKQVLERVYDCLQHDRELSEGHGHLHPDAKWIDGGRFTLMLTTEQKNMLFDIINNVKL